MVPRSFSPAHRSTAGYSAPAKDHSTNMNGKTRTSRSSTLRAPEAVFSASGSET